MFEDFAYFPMNFVWDSSKEDYFYNVMTQFGKSIKQDSNQAKSIGNSLKACSMQFSLQVGNYNS